MKLGPKILISLGAITAILGLGVIVYFLGAAMHTPPKEAEVHEHALRVHTEVVQPQNVPVYLTQNGTARARDVVSIAPEVSGAVVEVHDRLEVGEVIPKGETLFRIDPRNYEAAFAAAKADFERAKSGVERIGAEWRNDRDRLKTLERSRDLAEAEFLRVKKLFEEEEVGSRSLVEGAERQFNAAKDAVDQMDRALAVYPIASQEMKSAAAAAEAAMQKAQADRDRTHVASPFNARIVDVNIEEGAFVGPGAPVIVLADDSIIELAVALDTVDVRKWLKFINAAKDGTAWFGALDPVECRVSWTEDKENYQWRGTLHRVERYEGDTRKVTVAVRVTADDATEPLRGDLPLVDGMFCSVTIPGRTMESVYQVPQWAVSYDGSIHEGNIYLSVNNRLKIAQVKVVRRNGAWAYVSDGLNPGDSVVTTRLVNPLENTLLIPVDALEETD